MEPSNLQNELPVPGEGFKDERIIKLKEAANKEYKDMELQISNIAEMTRMFQDAVLAFECTSRRYAEILSRLLIETEPEKDKPSF